MRLVVYLRQFVTGVLVLSIGTFTASALQLGSRPVQNWIDRLEWPERIAGLMTPVVARLSLKPRMVIADLGAAQALSRANFPER